MEEPKDLETLPAPEVSSEVHQPDQSTILDEVKQEPAIGVAGDVPVAEAVSVDGDSKSADDPAMQDEVIAELSEPKLAAEEPAAAAEDPQEEVDAVAVVVEGSAAAVIDETDAAVVEAAEASELLDAEPKVGDLLLETVLKDEIDLKGEPDTDVEDPAAVVQLLDEAAEEEGDSGEPATSEQETEPLKEDAAVVEQIDDAAAVQNETFEKSVDLEANSESQVVDGVDDAAVADAEKQMALETSVNLEAGLESQVADGVEDTAVAGAEEPIVDAVPFQSENVENLVILEAGLESQAADGIEDATVASAEQPIGDAIAVLSENVDYSVNCQAESKSHDAEGVRGATAVVSDPAQIESVENSVSHEESQVTDGVGDAAVADAEESIVNAVAVQNKTVESSANPESGSESQEADGVQDAAAAVVEEPTIDADPAQDESVENSVSCDAEPESQVADGAQNTVVADAEGEPIAIPVQKEDVESPANLNAESESQVAEEVKDGANGPVAAINLTEKSAESEDSKPVKSEAAEMPPLPPEAALSVPREVALAEIPAVDASPVLNPTTDAVAELEKSAALAVNFTTESLKISSAESENVTNGAVDLLGVADNMVAEAADETAVEDTEDRDKIKRRNTLKGLFLAESDHEEEAEEKNNLSAESEVVGSTEKPSESAEIPSETAENGPETAQDADLQPPAAAADEPDATTDAAEDVADNAVEPTEDKPAKTEDPSRKSEAPANLAQPRQTGNLMSKVFGKVKKVITGRSVSSKAMQGAGAGKDEIKASKDDIKVK